MKPGTLAAIGLSGAALVLALSGRARARAAGAVTAAANWTVGQVVEALEAIQRAKLSELRAYWTKPRLRAAAIEAAREFGVPPEVVWGVIWRESGWRPVGLHGGSAATAKAARSTAWGMAQVLRSRFEAEARAGNPVARAIQHADLIDPRQTMRFVASSYARLLAARPNVTPTDLGMWWAGTPEGAARKAQDIKTRGPDVWAEE